MQKNKKIYFATIFLLLNCLLNAQQPLRLKKVKQLISTVDVGGYYSPQWSPDGKKIAVSKMNFRGIYVINADGSGLKTITEDEGAGFKFSFSPDSKEIVYRSRRITKDGSSKYILKTAEITTGVSSDLTGELNWVSIPSYSKRGIIMYSYGGRIMKRVKAFNKSIMRKSYSIETEVIDKVVGNVIVMTPAEDKIILEDDEGIKLIDIRTKNKKTIVKHGKNDFACDSKVSPDGKKVMYFNNVGLIGHLYVYDIDSEKITDLGEGYFGKWLPDGRIIYCITTNDGYVHTSSDLYIIGADGTGKVKITDTKEQIEIEPDISPDGKSVIYRDDNTGKIYIGTLE